MTPSSRSTRRTHPLGGALLEAKVGDTREYNLPNGSTMKVTLLSAEPYHS